MTRHHGSDVTIAALKAQLVELRQQLQALRLPETDICTCEHHRNRHGKDGTPCNVTFCMCEKYTEATK